MALPFPLNLVPWWMFPPLQESIPLVVVEFLVVFGFAFLYWSGNGVVGAKTLLANIYFSIVTVTTIGYGDYHPKEGVFQMLAGTEALFGTFMWAVFVAIFARKYMR